MESQAKKDYLLLCSQSPIPFFMQAWWMDAVCTFGKHWDVFLFVKNGQIIAAMPYHLLQKYGLKFIMMPQLTFFNGIWIEDKVVAPNSALEKEILTYFVQQIKSLKIVYFQQNFSPDNTRQLHDFQKRGYQLSTRYTYIVKDINDMDSVFKNFHSTKRGKIRKAERSELEVDFNLNPQQFAELFVEQHHRKGKESYYSQSFIQHVSQTAIDHQQGRILTVKDSNGFIHSALFMVWDKHSAYVLLTYINEECKSSGASTWMFFKAMQYLSGKTSQFDFEGSMIPVIAESYRTFGTVKTSYFSLEKFNLPLLKTIFKWVKN